MALLRVANSCVRTESWQMRMLLSARFQMNEDMGVSPETPDEVSNE